jgi:hypothetical protein
MTDDLLLPEGSVLVHIGPQKTGSTAVQQAMHVSRERLAAEGVHYPGPDFRLMEGGWAVMGIGAPVGRRAPRMSAWDRTVAELRASRAPRACVSTEDWARADAGAVEKIVTDLGADNVHVVFVARRLDRLLPSHWQERVKARMTMSYPEFLKYVVTEEHDSWEWRMMWEAHDLERVLRIWTQYVDPSRITVIVTDEGDRNLIPATFERMLGLAPGRLDPPQTSGSNRSLTYPEAEAIRHVNLVFSRNDWTSLAYQRIAQVGTALRLTNSPRVPTDPAIPALPEWALGPVQDRCDRQADAVVGSGIRVVGDPDRLRIRGRVEPGPEIEPVLTVSAELLERVVEGAVSGALDLQTRRLRAQRRRLEAQPPAPAMLGGRELARELGRRAVGKVRRSGRS